MIPLRAILRLRSPLGTPLAGDTLFGQLCHACREMHGEDILDNLLDGYGNVRPWLVVSDGFPSGYLPRPTAPAALQTACNDVEERKTAKGRHWIPHEKIGLPLRQLLDTAVSDEDAYGKQSRPVQAAVFHNTLNRLTGTTGAGAFAPYTQPQIFHQPGQRIDLWLLLDEARLARTDLRQLLEHVGSFGYGRDASIGLGKFEIESIEETALFKQAHPQANAFWTLAPCAPQGQGFDATRSYWRALTRFGRHGSTLARGTNPFKRPLLLAATGAVLTPRHAHPEQLFIGSGLTGISATHGKTLHQGYALALGIHVEEFA